MADGSKIEWTDATWNPITGCSVHSTGCKRCYAMVLAGTRMKHHWSRIGLTRGTAAGPVWTGEVRFNEEWLAQPLRWRRPREIFVCAHSDLFHDAVPDEWIDRIFAVMAVAPQHRFQVLTKRPERMRAWFSQDRLGKLLDAMDQLLPRGSSAFPGWPLPNVWLGVSAENQVAAEERIPSLLRTPATVRWLSIEPLLGHIHLGYLGWPNPRSVAGGRTGWSALLGCRWQDGELVEQTARLDWIVVGGESGPGARPMHPDWARSLRDQCAAAGVPFLFKQWGDWFPYGSIDADGCLNSVTKGERAGVWHDWGQGRGFAVRLGKKAAGRLLDGVKHDGFPADRTGDRLRFEQAARS